VAGYPGIEAAQSAGAEEGPEMRYRVEETSDVTAENLEKILNRWTQQGWRFDGMQFVVKESARRPSMAFVLFVLPDEDAAEHDVGSTS
jgi:hypothetical protein